MPHSELHVVSPWPPAQRHLLLILSHHHGVTDVMDHCGTHVALISGDYIMTKGILSQRDYIMTSVALRQNCK